MREGRFKERRELGEKGRGRLFGIAAMVAARLPIPTRRGYVLLFRVSAVRLLERLEVLGAMNKVLVARPDRDCGGDCFEPTHNYGLVYSEQTGTPD